MSLVSNDVADGSVLFCNTIYPEKSKLFSYGLSMLYPLMLTVVGEIPYLSMREWIVWLALWQMMAVVLSVVALLKYKKKEDHMLSVMSLIFAVVEGAFMSFVVIL